MKLLDKTGSGPKVAGVVGLVALVATILYMPEPAPEPTPAEPAPEVVEPEPAPAQEDDPQRLKETSRVRRLVPVYPGATFTPMGLLEANGNKMEMGFFNVKATQREVLDFYLREFGKRGHRVAEQPAAGGGGAVNYYDDTLGVLVSVTVSKSGTEREPRTLVFPSVTAAPDGIFIKAQAPEKLPQPDGVMTVMRVDDHTQGPSENSTTVTQVAPGTPKVLKEYYRKEMTDRGFVVIGQQSASEVEMLDFERPGERVSFTISPLAKQGIAESLIAVVIEDTSKKKGL
jgi:hypothetical protein